MPKKNFFEWENRRKYINDIIDVLLKDNDSGIYTVTDAKKEIAENYIFCDYRSIDRMLVPYEVPAKQISLFDTNQLHFNY